MNLVSDVTNMPTGYTHKVIVGTNHDKFLARLLELGEDYLEANRIFALFFVVTPPSEIENMKDYGEIIKHFPYSHRVCSTAKYVGNYDKRDQVRVINRMLKRGFVNYDIVEFIE